MALVLLRDENEGRDKHVESTLFPRLDEGSIPSSSTNKNRHRMMPIFICGALHFFYYNRASHGTQKGAGITFVIPIFAELFILYINVLNIILLLQRNEPRGLQ